MSVLEWRGGIPVVVRLASVGTTPVEVLVAEHLRRLPEYNADPTRGAPRSATTKWLRIQSHDAEDGLRVYFHEGDKEAGDNYILVHHDEAAGGYGMWEGPAEIQRLWVAADANTVDSVDIVFFLRKG